MGADITSAKFTSCEVINSLTLGGKECSLQTIEITNQSTDIVTKELALDIDFSHDIQLSADDIWLSCFYKPDESSTTIYLDYPVYSTDTDQDGNPTLNYTMKTASATIYFPLPKITPASIRGVPQDTLHVPLKKKFTAKVDMPIVSKTPESVSFTCITVPQNKPVVLPPPKKGDTVLEEDFKEKKS